VLDHVESDWTEALGRDPASAAIRVERAAARGMYGLVLGDSDVPAAEQRFRAACDDLDWVTQHQPQKLSTWVHRARVLQQWASVRGRAALDPTEQLEGSIAAFSRALEGRHGDPECLAGRAFSRRQLGSWVDRHGGDAEQTLRASASDLEAAVAARPDRADWYRDLGGSWEALSTALVRADKDPRESRGKAEQALTRAIELNPSDAVSWRLRGNLRLNGANWLRRRGTTDPNLYRQAAADYERSVELRPDYAEGLAPMLAECRRWSDGQK